MITKGYNKLIYSYDGENVWIEAWGKDALRIRATKCSDLPLEDWALLEIPEQQSIITIEEKGTIVNGKITATISKAGKIEIYNQNQKLRFRILKIIQHFHKDKNS